jgi:hypothetical protein
MPQLDKFAFAPQVFWLILVFFVLYLLLLRTSLSTIYKVLVFRKRMIMDLSSSVTGSFYEFFFLRLFVGKVITFFASTRTVTDPIFKLLDTNLHSLLGKDVVLKAARNSLISTPAVVENVATTQFLLPLVGKYSLLK